jgi:hypothetical protein
MLKFKITVGIIAVIYALHLLGIPQYLMRGPLREMTERKQAEIIKQCEAINCWHI